MMIQSSRFITYMVIFISITINIDARGQESQNYNLRDLREKLQRYPMYINAIDTSGHLLLQNVVISNDIGAVEIVLSAGADVNFQHAKSGNTALHYSRSSAITQKLIDYGADVNALNKEDESPLLVHIKHQELMVEDIHILLENGARTDIVSRDRQTVLHILFTKSVTGRYKNKEEAELKKTLFYETRLNLAKDLIAHGVDVKAVTEGGFTALHYAAKMGHNIEAIELLIAHGADVKAVTKGGGFTALHYAAKVGDIEAIELLIAHGADVNAVTNEGFTALHFAARVGHVEAIALLVAHAADINAVDFKYQQTPMMYAFDVEAMESVEMLLNLGGDFGTKDYRGYSVENGLRLRQEEDLRFPRLVSIIDQIEGDIFTCVLPLLTKGGRSKFVYY